MFSVPLLPEIPGLNTFRGEVMHSHDYRIPDTFKDKHVVVLGASFSGQEIALQISKKAREVVISHNRRPLKHELPNNTRQAQGITRMTASTVIMKDGEEIETDAVLFCTGYRKHFPFVSRECNLSLENERISPLYKHVLHADFPTLSFIDYCKRNIPFCQSECQVKFT